MDFPGGSDGKESACNAGDLNLISGLGRSPGEGNSYPLQYSGLAGYSPRGHTESGTTFNGLNGGPERCVPPEQVNKSVSGNRAFVDAFKDVEVRPSWVWVALNPISRFLVRDKRRETQTQRTSHMMRKAEMGGRGPQAQALLEPSKLEKAGRTSSWSPWRAAPP